MPRCLTSITDRGKTRVGNMMKNAQIPSCLLDPLQEQIYCESEREDAFSPVSAKSFYQEESGAAVNLCVDPLRVD